MEGEPETSASILLAFLHAMLKFPQVERKEEIDLLVAENRLPLWSDSSQLSYVS